MAGGEDVSLARLLEAFGRELTLFSTIKVRWVKIMAQSGVAIPSRIFVELGELMTRTLLTEARES